MKYQIMWESKLTNFIGWGEALFTLTEGREIVARLNEEYSYIKHWLNPVMGE